MPARRPRRRSARDTRHTSARRAQIAGPRPARPLASAISTRSSPSPPTPAAASARVNREPGERPSHIGTPISRQAPRSTRRSNTEYQHDRLAIAAPTRPLAAQSDAPARYLRPLPTPHEFDRQLRQRQARVGAADIRTRVRTAPRTRARGQLQPESHRRPAACASPMRSPPHQPRHRQQQRGDEREEESPTRSGCCATSAATAPPSRRRLRSRPAATSSSLRSLSRSYGHPLPLIHLMVEQLARILVVERRAAVVERRSHARSR